MAYIWINPVTESSYEPEALNEFLQKHSFVKIKTTGDWLSIVKEKYRAAVSEAKSPVVDMRCPRIKELLDEASVSPNVTIPDINPILIHCGMEIGEREDLADEEKIITTPCQSLADMGNALKLPNTRFVPWNQLLQELNDAPKGSVPHESPIPPGFFEELEVETVSVTGEDEILEYLKKHFRKGVANNIQLVEMLFCKEGCHNGDGIRECER